LFFRCFFGGEKRKKKRKKGLIHGVDQKLAQPEGGVGRILPSPNSESPRAILYKGGGGGGGRGGENDLLKKKERVVFL